MKYKSAFSYKLFEMIKNLLLIVSIFSVAFSMGFNLNVNCFSNKQDETIKNCFFPHVGRTQHLTIAHKLATLKPQPVTPIFVSKPFDEEFQKHFTHMIPHRHSNEFANDLMKTGDLIILDTIIIQTEYVQRDGYYRFDLPTTFKGNDKDKIYRLYLDFSDREKDEQVLKPGVIVRTFHQINQAPLYHRKGIPEPVKQKNVILSN